MHVQVAGDLVLARSVLLDLVRLEGDLGALLRVEEVGRLEVPVALLVVGGEAGGVDLEVDAALRRIVLVPVQRRGELAELPPDGRDHHVLDREPGAAVRRVGFQGEGCGSHESGKKEGHLVVSP